MTPPHPRARPAFASTGLLQWNAFTTPSLQPRRPLTIYRPALRMCENAPVEAPTVPLPKVPSTPMDPTLGDETGIVSVDASPTTTTDTWLDGVIASRGKLSVLHPLAALRAQANADLSSLPLPNRRMEEWRFTDLRTIYASHYVPAAPVDRMALEALDVRRYAPDTAGVVLVFVDGVYDEQLSLLNDDSFRDLEAAGGYFGSVGGYKGDAAQIRKVLTQGELSTDGPGGLFPTLAHAIGTDAVVLDVPDHFAVPRPVAVLFVSTSGESAVRAKASAARIAIIAGNSSKLTLLESHVSLDENNSYALTLSTTGLLVNENANVTHFYVNDCCTEAHLLSQVHAEVGRDATYEFRSIGLGSKVGRITVGVDLEGDGSHGAVYGSLIAEGYQVLDIHSRICHNARNTTSDQLQKNVAADHGRSIFKGKIVVTEKGITTDSSQLCRSLLISDKATVDAMPVLEIATDDVKCTHGATVSDLQDDELFYCQSRGLSHEQAQYLLISGFAVDVLGDCPFPSIQEEIAAKVEVVSKKSLKRDRRDAEFASI